MEKENSIRNNKGHFIKGHLDLVPMVSRVGRSWIAKKKDVWSYRYEKCIICGTTEKEHRGKGHCETCYVRIFSKKTRNSYRKNHPQKRYKKNFTSTGFRYSDATRQKTNYCEICNKECNTVLDHCHVKNKFRGWLCMSCNTSLGNVKDKIEILHKMIEYLVKNS